MGKTVQPEDFALRGMIWFVFGMFAVLSAVGSAAAQSRIPDGFPLMTEQDAVEFGFVAPLEVKRYELVFSNPGTEPVTIRSVQPSCPCMVASVPNKVVPAGESGKVIITIEGPDEPGPLDTKFVYVHAEGFGEPAQLFVEGEVTRGVRLTRGGLYEFQGRSGTLVIESVEGEPFRLLGVGGEPEGSLVIGAAYGEEKPRHEVSVEVKGRQAEDVARWIVVETDMPGAEVVAMKVRVPGLWKNWRPVRQWKWFKDVHRVEEAVIGEPTRFVAYLSGERYRDDLQFEARSLTEGVEARLVELRDPERGGGVECEIEIIVHEEGLLDGGMGFAAVIEMTRGRISSGLDVYGPVRR